MSRTSLARCRPQKVAIVVAANSNIVTCTRQTDLFSCKCVKWVFWPLLMSHKIKKDAIDFEQQSLVVLFSGPESVRFYSLLQKEKLFKVYYFTYGYCKSFYSVCHIFAFISIESIDEDL